MNIFREKALAIHELRMEEINLTPVINVLVIRGPADSQIIRRRFSKTKCLSEILADEQIILTQGSLCRCLSYPNEHFDYAVYIGTVYQSLTGVELKAVADAIINSSLNTNDNVSDEYRMSPTLLTNSFEQLNFSEIMFDEAITTDDLNSYLWSSFGSLNHDDHSYSASSSPQQHSSVQDAEIEEVSGALPLCIDLDQRTDSSETVDSIERIDPLKEYTSLEHDVDVAYPPIENDHTEEGECKEEEKENGSKTNDLEIESGPVPPQGANMFVDVCIEESIEIKASIIDQNGQEVTNEVWITENKAEEVVKDDLKEATTDNTEDNNSACQLNRSFPRSRLKVKEEPNNNSRGENRRTYLTRSATKRQFH